MYYKIVVTEKLLDCLDQGTYPSEKTVVQEFVPTVPDTSLYKHFGMSALESRRVVFQSLEAFKSLIVRPSLNCHTILTENIYSLKLRLALKARLQNDSPLVAMAKNSARGLARPGEIGEAGETRTLN